MTNDEKEEIGQTGSLDKQFNLENSGDFVLQEDLDLNSSNVYDLPITRWLPKADLYIGLIASSALINTLALTFPIMLIQVYDRVIPYYSTDTLTIMLFTVGIIILIEGFLRFARSYVSVWANARLTFLASCQAFKHVINSKLLEFERDEPGVHLERINALDTLKQFVSGSTIISLIDAPFIIIYLALIAHIHYLLVLVPIMMIALLIVLTYYSDKSFVNLMLHKSYADENKVNFLIGTLNGIHTVKSLGIEEQLLRRFEKLQYISVKEDFELSEKKSATLRITALISQANTIFIVGLAAYLHISYQQISIGGMAAATLLATRLIDPIANALDIWTKFKIVKVNKARRRKMESIIYEASSDAPRIEELNGSLELKNLSHRYSESGRWILEDVNFKVRPGEFITISSTQHEAGKSTLLDIIAALFAPTSGAILANDKNIFEHNLKSYREQIAFLPQNSILLDGTILENLTMFRQESLDDRSKSILEKLGLDLAINDLENGYMTHVGHGVVDFISRGLMQRILIARALLKESKILLLDESYNALDVASDKRFINYLKEIKGTKTIIIVTQRPSIIEFADTSYELIGGKLINVQDLTK